MKIPQNWLDVLKTEFESPKFKELQKFLNAEYSAHTIYPPADKIFNALMAVKFNDVKVVIIGQDPYHQPIQAHGLCFSVESGPLPPSLKNIFKEIQSDTGKTRINGNLMDWAKQGVLLLNTILTVRESQPNSHKNHGWEEITSAIISKLSARDKPIIFVLWGGNAKSFLSLINTQKHYVLMCAHPSPLSAYNGFFGCKHFSKINKILIDRGESPILW
ncbi:MAG: uracil-DNA glycosylase [Clostridia bacterium]